MKKLNQKGEIITIGIVAAGLIIGILGFLAGSTGLSKFIPGLHQKDNKTIQTTVSKSESKPIFVTDTKTGQQMVLYATKTETSTSDLSEEQKMSFWQKLLILPKLWLLFMILGVFFPPIAAFMGMFNHKVKDDFSKVVASVDAGLAHIEDPVLKQKFLDAMSKIQNTSTKELVSKIKTELKP